MPKHLVRLVWGSLPLAVLAATLLLAVLIGSTNANDSSANWDFEGPDARDGWTATNARFNISEDVEEGSKTAAILVASDTLRPLAITATLERDVAILPGYTYTFGGDYVAMDGAVDSVYLQVRLLDATRAHIDQFNSSQLPQLPGSRSGFFDAPCNALYGEFRVIVKGIIGVTAFVDDLFLKQGAGSEVCPTPVPTPTRTLTPTPSPSPTPIATDTPTPVATLTHTPTLIGSPTSVATSTASRTITPLTTLTQTPTPSRTPTSTVTATSSPTNAPSPAPSATATPTAIPVANTPVPTPTEEATPAALGLQFRNGGFEDAEEGRPVAWRTVGGLLMQADSPARSGSWSGAFFSSTASTKWVYQTVAVDPTTWYQFDAFVYHDDPWVEAAFLRISWYTSADGSGSALATIDSTATLASPQPEFRPLSTGAVMAPPGVHSAKLRVLMRPRDATNAIIYIDTVSFATAAAPAPPSTATIAPPTAAASATSMLLPPPTPSPSATATAATPTAATTTPLPPTATAVATISSQDPAPADAPPSALANAGFEDASEGTLTGWQTYGGLLTQIASPARSGSAAGAFFSSSSSTKWVFQTVAVESASWYQFDAFVYHDHAWVESAFLRISWYASADGSGSALASVDSTALLTAPEQAYRLLSTGPTQAPPGARAAKLRIIMRPRDGTSALFYIDDASFQQVTEPAFKPPPQIAEQPESRQVAAVSRASAPPVRAPLAVARPQPLREPMSAPVIRRHTLRTPDQLATPRHNDGPLWPWALFGGITGAGVVALMSYLAQRREEAES